MAAARSSWTDSRLDDLKESVVVIDEKVTRLDVKVDKGFARQDANVDRLDAKIDGGFARLDGRIEEVNDRIDKLNHVLVQSMIALISVIAVLLSALVAIGATNL